MSSITGGTIAEVNVTTQRENLGAVGAIET